MAGHAALILNFGSCFSGVLVRVLRDVGINCVLESAEKALDALNTNSTVKVAILCGGLDSVYDETSLTVPEEFIKACEEKNVKILAISHAFYALCKTLGARLMNGKGNDYIIDTVTVQRPMVLFNNVGKHFKAKINPINGVEVLPAGFESLATFGNGHYAAIGDEKRGIFGVAFHPESDDTENGLVILKNFCLEQGACPIEWSMEQYLKDELARCIAQCGDTKVVVAGLSGGVDSTVCAAIVHKAIGNRFHGVMINTGLMRLDETKKCAERLKKEIPGIQLHIRESADVFFGELKGILDPEQKRKIIGKVYIDEFERAIKDLGFDKSNCLLLQGTIYPDILESELNRRNQMPIKSHHNVGGLPKDLALELIEPVRLLFKEEVRKLGRLLGLSQESCERQPFPGPGLGVRVIGELNPRNLDLVRRADAVMNQILDARGYRSKISQSGCILLADVHNTGIRNSGRTYGHAVIIRIIITTDFVTAQWARIIDTDCLAEISKTITDTVPEITRVCYDITDKPPACIEWE
ncbi:bifunctional GMP synthetase ATP pyrophosphatase domain/Class I glutamine amidotransferase-like/Rossmann-like alpha-beta-alpha sandwich fold/GMP synthase [Babesia duncani]|uniref:GMP synthase (glutamine-hydrolyzing) n=1 Tax=Babesia duncani TaxID=323732 RepID=A0AAD9PL95_9APIC|nr:bifunctional GMP synthetase ATP pyrophosphatase domain/Class I glutamine amidotransferase-like/Rossmann-like alpha-beta-alpha sandwich fold/GMP synthase [Babesia duncani]